MDLGKAERNLVLVGGTTGMGFAAAAGPMNHTHLASNPVRNMRVALERGGRPREAGELIAFLLSDRAAFMTGAAINIDGGTDL